MELNKGHIALTVVCFIAGAIIGAGLRSCSVKPGSTPPEQVPPVVIHDNILLEDSSHLASHTKPKGVVRHDTVWLTKPTEIGEVKNDTTIKTTNDTTNDTTSSDADFALVPITQHEYRDTFQTDSSRIELGVRFSGYDAKIENVDLQYCFNVQPRTIVKKKGWGQFIGVGIGFGYGASVVGQKVYAAPEVGVHITYGWGYHW